VTVSSSSRATAWSPRIGLTYQPIQAISFYATYNRSFQPQIGTDVNGVAFKPELGRLLETGFKFDTAQHRIQATASVYQINQTNVITSDPNNPGFSIQLGEQRSRGVEFNATTHLMHRWDLITGYALTNATIQKDNTYVVDSFLQSVPRHTGNLWTRYNQTHGFLTGASIGAVSRVSPGCKDNSLPRLRRQLRIWCPAMYEWTPASRTSTPKMSTGSIASLSTRIICSTAATSREPADVSPSIREARDLIASFQLIR
jgi:outer membrane receptor for ferric coprogen and ferric-rhodotorulic acid